MLKSISNYIQRSRTLGPANTLQHIWTRFISAIVLRAQSIWWGWIAHREISDRAMLARTTGQWRSVDALLDHLAGRPASSFLLPHESAQETAKIFYQNYPEYIAGVLAGADAACRNEISLLGRVFEYPNGIDWHSEPASGWRWPVLHISRMGQYLWSSTRRADVRLVWELNRHQYFINLGLAYWVTGEKKYVDSFITHIQSWIKANPLQHGLNWYSSLEISIRLLAWTTAFQFFRNSPDFRQKAGAAFLKSLWQQADFLGGHLQHTIKDDFPNNHIIGELSGLILMGVVFPEFKASAGWREAGLQLLNQQVAAQTHSDGVNKEQASGYHRFVAEFLFLIVARERRGTRPSESILAATLEHMFDYMLFSLTPLGTSPMWGDSDSGYTLGSGKGQDFWDFQAILSAGAVLFRRGDWKIAAHHYDAKAFLLLGLEGLNTWTQLEGREPEKKSNAFPEAGLYIIREKWTADTDVAFFRCGPFGLGGEGHCAHSHCDLLSVLLWVNGQPLLVDSGTFTYHGSWRNSFRLTASHNTIMVDDCEQAQPAGNFNWRQIPQASFVEWTENRVTGKLTYPGSVDFVRELDHPRPGQWNVNDKFFAQGTHKLSWFFHFATGLNLRWEDRSSSVIVEKEGEPFAQVFPPKAVFSEIKSGWTSYSYGTKEPNPLLYGSWSGDIPNSGVDFSWKFVAVTKNNEVR